jgi:hypothetical protein
LAGIRFTPAGEEREEQEELVRSTFHSESISRVEE